MSDDIFLSRILSDNTGSERSSQTDSDLRESFAEHSKLRSERHISLYFLRCESPGV